ncbi:MAG: hypothetical protein ACREAB_17800, partial [Blastocatellia bacterium]
LITLLCGASLAARAQNEGESVVVAGGTQVRLVLQTPLNSKLSEVGDRVTALLEDEAPGEDGRIAIPHGAEFRGRITQVQPAGRLHRQATMTVVFETVRLAQGVEKISTVVTAIDNQAEDRKLKAKNDEGKVGGGRSGERTIRNAGRGAVVGLIGGAIVGVVGGRLPVTEARVGLGVGTAGGILGTKGNDIKLPPGTILRIRFERPLTTPAAEPERSDDGRKPL